MRLRLAGVDDDDNEEEALALADDGADKVASLADLLSDITQDAASENLHHNGRGTRFTHASEFGQEVSGNVGHVGM